MPFYGAGKPLIQLHGQRLSAGRVGKGTWGDTDRAAEPDAVACGGDVTGQVTFSNRQARAAARRRQQTQPESARGGCGLRTTARRKTNCAKRVSPHGALEMQPRRTR